MTRRTWIIAMNSGLFILNAAVATIQYVLLDNCLFAMCAAFIAGVSLGLLSVAVKLKPSPAAG